MCDTGYGNIMDFMQDKLGKSWIDFKSNRTVYIGKIKEVYIGLGNTESDYANMLTTIRREIDEFDSAQLKDELNNYFKVVKDEKVVFLFDEASEAINQGKFTLLDLQGLSTSLSSLGGKVWTIAIAHSFQSLVFRTTRKEGFAMDSITNPSTSLQKKQEKKIKFSSHPETILDSSLHISI